MPHNRFINSVTFNQESLTVEYGELYEFGVVKMTRIDVPLVGGSQYLDECMAVETSVQALLEDVLEDTNSARVVSIEEMQEAGQDDDEIDLELGG